MHPAMYSYFISTSPDRVQFPDLGRLVAYLREHDPAHMAYINLFPHPWNHSHLATHEMSRLSRNTSGSSSTWSSRHC